MKLKYSCLLMAFLLLSGHLWAQDSLEVAAPSQPLRPNAWFVGAGGGAQWYLSYDNSRYNYSEVCRPAYLVSFGKMMTPNYGFRGNLFGFESVQFTDYNRYNTDGSRYFDRYRHYYVGTNLDLYLNMSNLLFGNQRNSKFSWTLFGGPGIEFARPNDPQLEIFLNLGVGSGMKYQLKPYLSIDLEARVMATSSLFLNQGRGSIDGIGMISAGVNYYFGGKDLKNPYKEMYIEIREKNTVKTRTIKQQQQTLTQQEKLLAATHKEMARLNKALDERDKELADCCKKEAKSSLRDSLDTPTRLPDFLIKSYSFGAKSSQLSEQQIAYLEEIGAYLQRHTYLKIGIIGYGDYDSSMSSAQSYSLSQSRARKVAEVFKSKFGIDAKRIRIMGKGDMDKSSVQMAGFVVIVDDK